MGSLKSLFLAGLLLAAWLGAVPGQAARCLYVSSYHSDYPWDQGIRRGLSPLLARHCELSFFYMDTKRNREPDFAAARARQALAIIESEQPDVVIAADDNASRYLVVPYLRDSSIPVVFCGVNTSAAPYDYPYSNATGMVEVTPHRPLLLALQGILPSPRKGLYLAADVLSQRRMYARLRERFSQAGIELEADFVDTQQEWESSWLDPQRGDFLFVGNPAGIEFWDSSRALRFVQLNPDILTLTAWDWLAPMAMITVTKDPEEQGLWAASVARKIIVDGVSPGEIPVVTNRHWRMLANRRLLERGGFSLPLHMRHVAEELER
jgi:hypothetical protein